MPVEPLGLLRIVAKAAKEKKKLFVLVATLIVLLDIFVPPLVLSLVRKPVDFLWANPYLSRVPEYLASDAPIIQKVNFLSGMALFWFGASNPFGTEWGFIVSLSDVLRFLLMGLIFGAYFSTWSYARAVRSAVKSTVSPGGLGGSLLSVLGLSTGPCSVVGCGAPVIPALGLAFTGLSTGTLLLLGRLANVLTVVILSIMALSTLLLANNIARLTARSQSGSAQERLNLIR